MTFRRLTDIVQKQQPPSTLSLKKEKEVPPENALTLTRTQRRSIRQFDIAPPVPSTPQTASRAPRIPLPAIKFGITLLLATVSVFLLTSIGSAAETAEEIASRVSKGFSAITQARTAYGAGDATTSLTLISEAASHFKAAEHAATLLSDTSPRAVPLPETIERSRLLLRAADSVMQVADQSAALLESFSTLKADYAKETALASITGTPADFTPRLTALLPQATAIAESARRAKAQLALLPRPPEELASLTPLLTKAEALPSALNALTLLLGATGEQRTLILLQNSSELRPTGGFLGSFLDIRASRGHIMSRRITDIYDVAGQLSVIEPPKSGYDLLTNRHNIQDSNFSPDFPTSATEFLRLFELSKQGSANAVCALTTRLADDLIARAGGMQLPQSKTSLPPKDALTALSLIVEHKLTGATTPKAVLTDAFADLTSRLAALPPESLLPLFVSAIESRDIQCYSPNAPLQSHFHSLGIDGTQSTAPDALGISFTSLSGNKSDAFMQRNLTLSKEGDTVTVTLRQQHTFSPTNEAHIVSLAKTLGIRLSEKELDISGRGTNVSQISFFLPEDATALTSSLPPLSQEGRTLTYRVTTPRTKDTTLTFSFTTSTDTLTLTPHPGLTLPIHIGSIVHHLSSPVTLSL